MNIVSDLKEWQKIRLGIKGTVGFVPTMGNLHAGHAALVQRAREENDVVIVSIFVNPTQFNQPSDFEKYARTLEEDTALLKKIGVDFVLTPHEKGMYPDNYEMRVAETGITSELEGKFRPGHFSGMMTVVLKLLNLAQATRAYFGEKDYQQLLLVQKMAAAFFIPTEIISCETVRAETGLALSSRNARLSKGTQRKAALIFELLSSAKSDADVIRDLEKNGFKVEYVETKWGRRLAACWLEDVRLIDNVPLETRSEKHVAVS